MARRVVLCILCHTGASGKLPTFAGAKGVRVVVRVQVLAVSVDTLCAMAIEFGIHASSCNRIGSLSLFLLACIR